MKNIVDAVTHGPDWNTTILLICYDGIVDPAWVHVIRTTSQVLGLTLFASEAGGFGDPVYPYHSPQGTPGEWFEDPYGELGYTFSGPGMDIQCI